MASGIVRVLKRDESYTILDPFFLSDERLSWKAKGLLGYLLSKPSNWRVYVSDLVKRSKDGRDAVYSALKELEAAGYIDRKQTRENGKITGYETIVYERPRIEDNEPAAEPVTENTEVESEPASSHTENPEMEKSNAEKATLNNININNIDLKMNECMSAPEDDPILTALSRELSAIPLNDTHSVADFYFAEIYAALVRNFSGLLDVPVISIAAEHYGKMAIDWRTNRPRINVKNPVGLFVDAYRAALSEWKATRYRKAAGR